MILYIENLKSCMKKIRINKFSKFAVVVAGVREWGVWRRKGL